MKNFASSFIALLAMLAFCSCLQAQGHAYLVTNDACWLKINQETKNGFSKQSCYLEIRDPRLGHIKAYMFERFLGGKDPDPFWLTGRYFQGQIISKDLKVNNQRNVFPSISASLFGRKLEINIFQNKRLLVTNRINLTLASNTKSKLRRKHKIRSQALIFAPTTYESSCEHTGTISPLSLEYQQIKSPSKIPLARKNWHSGFPLLTISTEADHEFFQFYGRKARARIQAVLNTAETIYREQLGIGFDLIEQHQQRTLDQFLTSNLALALLFQFRNLNSLQRQLGVAKAYHLFTGKQLDGSTLGIHFQGFFCQNNNLNYGLSRLANSGLQAIITAHEIGHGFNATHPEDTLINPLPSLMSGFAALTQTTFSEFSTNEINDYLSSVDSCLLNNASSATSINNIITVRSQNRTRVKIKVQRKRGMSETCSYQLFASSSSQNLKGIGLAQNSPAAIAISTTNRRKLSFRLNLQHKRQIRPRNRIIFRVLSNCAGEIARSNLLSIRVPLSPDNIQLQIDNFSQ